MFFGREEQLKELEQLSRKRVASLVTCRGRRRIGKSTLVEHFAARSKCRFIKIEGKKPERGYTNQHELEAFAEQLAAQTGAESGCPSNWLNAFIRLDGQISARERTVVLLDEISWMGHYDETFASTLKIAWDNYWKKHDRLIVVLCGSVSSWIRDNIIDNSAFMGRRSLDIVVPELSLSECVGFWGRAASRTDPREIIDVLSVTGGIPRYLEEIDPAMSASENIRRMGFMPHGVLRDDFDEMFSDVITHLPAMGDRILRVLVDGHATVSEIAQRLGMSKGGSISRVLDELSQAGLVMRCGSRDPMTGKEIREVPWRVRDNYARFYLKCIEPRKREIDAGAFASLELESLPGWDAIMGLAFENLVVNNAQMLTPELHLDRTLILSLAPYLRHGAEGRGVQVDLLIQTARRMCLVEVKRMREIPQSVADEMESCVAKILRPKGVSVQTALVYDGSLAPGLEADGYFDVLIPFARLLGL